jgi:hypothetical protein
MEAGLDMVRGPPVSMLGCLPRTSRAACVLPVESSKDTDNLCGCDKIIFPEGYAPDKAWTITCRAPGGIEKPAG